MPSSGSTATTTSSKGTASSWKTGHGTPVSTGLQHTTAPKELPFKPSTNSSLKALFTPKNLGKALTSGAAVAIPLVATPLISALLNQACVRAFGGAMTLSPGGEWEECRFTDQTVTLYHYGTGSYGVDPNWYTSRDAAAQGYIDAMLPKKYVWSDCQASYSWTFTWVTQSQPKFHGVGSGCVNSVGVFGGASSTDQFGQEATKQDTQKVRDGWQPSDAGKAEDAIDKALAQMAADDAARGAYTAANPGMQGVLDELFSQGQGVDGQLLPPVVETPVLEPVENVVQTDPATGKTYQEQTQTQNDYQCLVIEDGKAVRCSQSKTITKTGTTTTVDPSNPNATPTTTTTTTVITKTGDVQPPEQKDPCDTHPDRVGCVDLGTPSGEIPKKDIPLTYTPESVLGSGSCPADKTMTLAGKTIKAWDWQQSCSYIVTYVKPVVVAVSAFIALMIVLPGVKVE